MEVMVAMSILIVMMLIVVQIIRSTSQIWTSSGNKINAFQGARAAFETMTRNLSQATLQTYYGYADLNGNPVPLINPSFLLPNGGAPPVPAYYLRASELHFVSDQAASLFSVAGVTPPLTTLGDAVFFQAPSGLVNDQSYRFTDSLLNIYGYYVEYVQEVQPQSIAVSAAGQETSYRYRLMEAVEPAEKNSIYQSTLEVNPATQLPVYNYDLKWIQNMGLSGTASPAHVLADNIIVFAILPKLSASDEATYGVLSPNYAYDSRSWETGYTGKSQKATATTLANPNAAASTLPNAVRNQLPPVVEVVMVAIDETAANRLALKYKATPPFSTGEYSLSGLFTDGTKLQQDLATVETRLQGWGINYRVFQTEVSLQAANWSN